MSKVAVYRFTKYDITTDQFQQSHRMGTRAAIERVGGEVLEDTAIEVDASAVDTDIDGMTVRNFDPRPRTGFQSQVTT